jgi:hypothetical protein
MFDLVTLADNADAWTLVEATSINDRGVIVGNGALNGEPRAFMAIPVPQPTAGTLTVMGGTLLAMRRWNAVG